MAPLPQALRRSNQRSSTTRQASVMILLFPTEAGLTLVLNRRSTNPHDVHSGQISLPGGAQEPGETAIETALRETYEEVGVDLPIQIIGKLSCLYIPPSDFEVQPVVGYLTARPIWQPDPIEVAEVIECPLAWLLDEKLKVIEEWDWNGSKMNVPWYNVQGHKVWGATAIILSELEQRLRRILGQ
ncbi:MAG: CoA pyrophosphatase [Chloroflexi bacterium]|nr:CoA pyrophosphatase [Chloroflexota bacterium]